MNKKLPPAKPVKSRVEQMLDKIRAVLSDFSDIPEALMYEALFSEAEGWEMRLQEIESEDEKDFGD